MVSLAAAVTMLGCSSAPPEEAIETSEQALTAPAWQPGKAYAVGDLVSYNGKVYRVVQAHSSQAGWNPEAVAALYAFEGLDTGSNTPATPTTPPGKLTLDYVAGVADCNNSPESCCAPGATYTPLTANADVHYSTQPNRCVSAAQGNDTVFLQSNGPSSLILGVGDDTAMDGAGDDLIWGGHGRDTINGYGGTNLFFGSYGDDTIMAANGTNSVVPGPGLDIVSTGTGDDKIYIFDVCEIVSGEQIAGGTGFDTLYSPLTQQELANRGVVISSIEKFVVRDGHCNSECADRSDCGTCFVDSDTDGVVDCREECPLDKKKTEAGICGCGVDEKDTDGDLVPDCVDECDKDAAHQSRGTCGCVGESDLKAAGTACSDGIAEGTFTCDGAGTCGNPNSVAPETGCALTTFGTHYYWSCPDRTPDQAAARCNATPGRRLVRIDSKIENSILAKRLTRASLIGATDRANEGEWTWQFTPTLDDTKFWTGGATGRSFGNLFSRFASGKPVDPGGNDADCAVLDPSSASWMLVSCASAAPYVCEGLFGPSRTPGSQTTPRPILGPEKFYPNYQVNADGTNPNGLCEVWNDRNNTFSAKYGKILDPGTVEVWDCDEKCGPDAADTPELRDACRAQHCKGDALPPPEGAPACSDPGGVLTKVAPPSASVPFPIFFDGACRLDDPKTTAQNEENFDCTGSPVSAFGVKVADTTCGIVTKCLQLTDNGSGAKVDKSCSSSSQCASGNYCDSTLKKCVNPRYLNACGDLAGSNTSETKGDDGSCFGKCYDAVGCGIPVNADAASEPNTTKICRERNLCIAGGEYAEPLEADSDLSPSEADTANLKDDSALPAPPYSGDFSTACGVGGCGGCKGDASTSCDRSARHPWCNAEASLPTGASPMAGVTDNKAAHRGKDAADTNVDPSPVSFDLDPKADLNFKLNPLPFGLTTFDLNAIAAISAVAKFDFAGISGSITVVNLKAQLSATLCRVSTADSRAEVLGIDFIPQIQEKTGVIFDSSTKIPNETQKCEEAVATFVDTVDRAKKALRDTQELIRQYEDAKSEGVTFDDEFCKTVAGAGMRPKNMPGYGTPDPCANESVEDTINAFIGYYEHEAGAIKGAKDTLAANVLRGDKLAELLGIGDKVKSYAGFDFYAGLGDGFGDERTTTIINLNFMIGPIPANLEVSSYVGYGVDGGFGANLRPAVLVAGSGEFATAGVVVTPRADAGVTLFVGAGFDAGPVSLKLGIDGSVTLANVRLPITGKAGLSVAKAADDRLALPPDLAQITDGYPVTPELARTKASFQFTYSYGVSLTLENMLSGKINASLIIEFFFFSQKFSQQLLSFSGLPPIHVNLLSGGSPEPAQWPANPVKEETRGWASGYDTLVLYRLTPLDPPREPLPRTAEFDNTKVSQLFYDSLCSCEEPNTACDRDADCCGNSGANPFVCFSDPTMGGAPKCSACREYKPPTLEDIDGTFESCNEDGDCCTKNCELANVWGNCRPVQGCSNAEWKASHSELCDLCNDIEFCMANDDPGGICVRAGSCFLDLAIEGDPPRGYACDAIPRSYKTCRPPEGTSDPVVVR